MALETRLHEYYTNGSLSGSTDSTRTGAVGETISTGSIDRQYTYNGVSYRYTSANPETLTLAVDGDNTITLRYDRTTGGGSSTPPTPPTGGGDDPIEPNDPTPVEITDPDVPLADVPQEETPEEVIVPDEDVPLAETPEDLTEIPDEDVPLADVPKTGDSSSIWRTLTLISGMGLALLALGKKREDTAE